MTNRRADLARRKIRPQRNRQRFTSRTNHKPMEIKMLRSDAVKALNNIIASLEMAREEAESDFVADSVAHAEIAQGNLRRFIEQAKSEAA